MLALAVVTMFAVLVLIGATLIRRTAPPAWALIAASAFWLWANRPVEGPILFRFNYQHGLTLGDLLAVLGALVGTGVLLLRAWRDAPRADRAWRLATITATCWAVLATGAVVGSGAL